MNLLLMTSHSIAEFDDVRMFTDMGVDVFSIGAYEDPTEASWLRPALPDAPDHPELRDLLRVQRQKHAAEGLERAIDWAKADLHPDLIDWADVIVCHHFPDTWLLDQWPRIRGKRVIWRTCGQSDLMLEDLMGQLRRDGLQIVRYSPKEQEAFTRMGVFGGQDALIRFGKYPSDYGPWVGDDLSVGNVTQNMVERGDYVGYGFWLAATQGLPVKPAGPPGRPDGPLPAGSVGSLTFDEMREYLRHLRAYLYTGTNPASYTLGLIEALMSGVPTVSISARAWAKFAPASLFEGEQLAPLHAIGIPGDPDTETARVHLAALLADRQYAEAIGEAGRDMAIETFGIEAVSAQWGSFLDMSVAVAA